MSTRSILRCAMLLGLGTIACGHSEPFRPGVYVPEGPLSSLPPIRLTFNPGHDLIPAWLPDGSGFLYTAERWDRADHDRCLAFMPAGGGAITRYDCPRTTADDTVHVFEEAVPGADRIAYVRARTNRLTGGPAPDAQELVTASRTDPADTRVVSSVPFTTPWGTSFEGIGHPLWVSDSRLVVVGQRVRYPRPCMGCPRDTVRTGIEIAAVDLGSDPPSFALIPGTADASSLSLGATGDTVYFTRVGDSRVYRIALSTNQVDTVFDFGSAGIARDLTVANGRFVAVVGGLVRDSTDPFLGRFQTDDGGPLYFVTLADGIAQLVGDSATRFRRPALSPDGGRLIVTAWDALLTGTDLWEYDLP